MSRVFVSLQAAEVAGRQGNRDTLAAGPQPHTMAKSRTDHPLLLAFGAALGHLHVLFETRSHRQFSHDALARLIQAKRAGLTLSGPTLFRWETGQTWSPDPVALIAAAELYRVPAGALFDVLLENRSQPALSREAGVERIQGALHARHGEDQSESDTVSYRGWKAESPEPGGLSPDDAAALATELISTANTLHRRAEEILRRQARDPGASATGRMPPGHRRLRPRPR